MTTKERALNMVWQFYKCMPFKDVKLTSCDENPDLIIEMEKLSAKQCALIAVDEITGLLENSLIEWHVLNTDEISNYWQQVKEEIEKI